MRRFVFILISFISFFIFYNADNCLAQEKNVLLISSYHPAFPTFFQQVNGLKSVLEPADVNLDVEFMDSKRFYVRKNLSFFHDMLKFKLSSIPAYDVIVTADDNALEFAIQYRDELFPDTPVVFCGLNNQDLGHSLNGNINFTGVIEAISLGETLDLIKQVLPKTKNVYTIVDSTLSGQGDYKLYKSVRHKFPELTFHDLSLKELSWSQLRTKLENITTGSAILLLSAYRDKYDISMSFAESLSFILSNSNVPIFHNYEHGIGHGILGGKVISHFDQGRIAGGIALDILNGKKVIDIPVVEAEKANKYIFDRNILKKYDIRDSFLPKNSTVINEEKSVFMLYKLEIVGIIVFACTLIVFLFVILFYYIRLRKTEDKVRESESRFAFAMEANKDGIWDWNIQTNDVYYSPGYKAMLGYKIDEVPDNVDSWLDLIHADDRANAYEANHRCIINEASSFEVEFRMLAKDGTWRWILGRGKAFERDEDGQAIRVIGTHTDITERKKSENEIRNLRNYLKSIIDSMPFVLIGLDHKTNVTLWNAKAVEVTGLTAADTIGKPVAEVFPRLLPHMESIKESLVNHKIYLDSRLSRREEGELWYDDVTIYPLSSNDDHGAVIIVDDVTERVRLEELVVQNEKMLSVGGLAAGMAHEINNPLGVIIQGAQNIQRRAFGFLPENLRIAKENNINLEDVHSYLNDRNIPKILDGVNSAALRAARIVSNMLSFSRKNDDDFKDNDLRVLLDETVELARNEYDLATKYDFRKIIVVREYDKKTPLVHCERGEIQQVILNLLKNGAQSMHEKEYTDDSPKFTLRVKHKGNNAIIEVEDNGKGIARDARKRIFEPFYTTKQVGEGTGLGLAISYFIITDLHKGKMEVYSTPGLWTKFIITLPLISEPQ